MGNKGQNEADKPLNEVILAPILVPPKVAFRALAISENLGYRLIRQRVIPTIKLPNGPQRVPVDELKKMLAAMVQTDRICRTCAKHDGKGKCAVYGAAPSDLPNCSAWTFDENWNVKVFTATRKYQSK